MVIIHEIHVPGVKKKKCTLENMKKNDRAERGRDEVNQVDQRKKKNFHVSLTEP